MSAILLGMAVFYISDTHFSHPLVSGLRGFRSVEEHDETIFNNIHKQVRTGDTLWILGDVVFGSSKREMLERLRYETIGVTLNVILGNHDRPSPVMSNGHNFLQEWTDLFDFVGTYARVSPGWMLSHYPYDTRYVEEQHRDYDETREDRFDQYRVRDCGRPLIHGHTHNPQKYSISNKGTPQVNVCLEAWDMRPVPHGQIVDLLASKGGSW